MSSVYAKMLYEDGNRAALVAALRRALEENAYLRLENKQLRRGRRTPPVPVDEEQP